MDLIILGLAATSVGAASLVFIYYLIAALVRFTHRHRYSHLRGATFGDLKQQAAKHAYTLTLAGIPIPNDLEPRHVMLSGTTGTGKTVAMSELIEAALKRGDRAVIVDPGGQFVSWFYDPERDAILNPFDVRAPGWSVFNEIRGPYDYDKLAHSVVPPGTGGDAAWQHYAQRLFASTAKQLAERGKASTQALMDYAAARPLDELGALLAGTPEAQLCDKSNVRMAGSVRSVLATYLKSWNYLTPGDFSLRAFMADETKGSIYLTWREDQTATLKPLISTWLDILTASTLSLPPDNKRRVWLFIDELGTLQQLASLQDALTKGRKFGLCAVLGFQTLSQLRDVYGREQAQTLLANLGTLLVLRTPDPETAEYCSVGLGEREVLAQEHAKSFAGWLGLDGHSNSTAYRTKNLRLVLPSELQNLQDLAGYMTLPGAYPVAKVKLDYVARVGRHPAIEETRQEPLVDQVKQMLSL